MTSTRLHRLFWGSFVKASMCSEPTLFQVLGRHKQRLLALQNTDKFIILLNKALGGFVLHTADYKFVWIFKIRDVVFQKLVCS